MKSIAIWINNYSSIENDIEKNILKLNYINEYKTHLFKHYLIYFSNYYQNYFYKYFLETEKLDIKTANKRVLDDDIQEQLKKLSYDNTLIKMKDVDDSNEKLNEYLNKSEYVKDFNKLNCLKDNLENMISKSISLFKQTNPFTKTVFINYGDELSKVKADEIIHNPFINYNEFKFSKYYKHLSSNSYNYELFCFLRWFIIRDYVNSLSEKYDRIYIFDNDTLVFDTLDNYYFDDNNVTMSICGCPAFTILNTQLLNQLCNRIMSIYINNEEECFKYSEEIVGVISDMGVFNYLCHKGEIQIVNEEFFKPYFIINIGFLIENESLPKFKFKNNKLYLKDITSNCIAIHFAGSNKKYMDALYEAAIR